MSNVVYLNPIQRIRRFGYAQVDKVANGEATRLIGADGDKIAVIGTIDDLPALEAGDWVQVLETTFGASIVMRIEVTRNEAVGEDGLLADGWHEYYDFPVLRDIWIKVVWSGWIMYAHDEKYFLLEADTISLRDQDGRLMHFEKHNGVIRIHSDNAKTRIRMDCVIIRARSLSIRLNTQASSPDDQRS